MADEKIGRQVPPPSSRDRLASLVVISAAIYLGAARHLAGLAFPIADMFHYGEFLAAAITVLEGPPYDGLPYTLHGVVDILPAYLLDRFGVPRDLLLAYTIALYPLMEILAVLFSVLAALRFARLFGISPLLMSPFAVFASYGLGWRDLILCFGLYVFAVLVSASEKTGERRWGLQVVLGAATAFGLYWSFNRGIAMVAGLGAPLLVLAILSRAYMPAILSFVVCAGLFGLVLPGMSPSHYVDNFSMLLETSSKWQYELTAWHMRSAGIIIALNAFALLMGLWFVLRRNPPLNQIVILAGLSILSILFTKIGLGRIDYTHMVMALWAPLLLVSLVAGATAAPMPRLNPWAIGAVAVLGVAAMFVALLNVLALPILSMLLLMALALMPSRVRSLAVVLVLSMSLGGIALGGYRSIRAFELGRYDWLAAMTTPPATPEVVSDGVLWTGRKLQELNATCVFELVNAGLIHAVSGLPACSQFTYLIYAGAQNEAQLIADLRAQAPPVIVYSADYWSYSIDGITMAERYPVLDAEIRARYGEEECRYGFCIRF